MITYVPKIVFDSRADREAVIKAIKEALNKTEPKK